MGISIFALAPILATALNRRSSAASLTVTSYPLFPISFSLSASLISPASTFHLCVVSMASSLARNSHISLSLDGSGIGIGLSLLLGGMVVKSSPVLCYRSKELVLRL
jgi:hypothetical protein